MSTNKDTFKLCTQASYQIEAMCFALKNAARSQDVFTIDALPYLVQSLAQRINDLSVAWILAQDGMDDDNSGFEQVVYGFYPEVTA